MYLNTAKYFQMRQIEWVGLESALTAVTMNRKEKVTVLAKRQ